MKNQLFIIVFVLFSLMASSQVSKTINVPTAGTLSTLLTGSEKSTVTNLTITGNIDARDVKTMRDNMPLLAVLDMGAVSIKEFSGDATNGFAIYPANEMPQYSFCTSITYRGKTSLRTIIFPTSITSIGISAFENCTGFTGILTLGNSITAIGIRAFSYCSGFRGSLILPNSVTTIGSGAFSYCSGFTSLTLPSSVTTIENAAFYYCTGFTDINSLNATPPTLGPSCFAKITSITDVFVPTDAAVTTYKASSWYTFFTGTIIKKASPSATSNLNNSTIKVYPLASEIFIEGTSSGESATLYSINGKQIQTIKSQGNRMDIPVQRNAVYLVKTAGRTFKVKL